MRVFLGFLFSLIVVFACVAKDGERDYPSWFIVAPAPDNAESVVIEEAIPPAQEEQSMQKNEEPVIGSIKSRKGHIKKSHFAKALNDSIKDKHFAKNNKDLLLAEKLFKAAYANSNNANVVVSPLSFYTVSVLIANGVVDETLFEFSSIFPVLHLGDVNKMLKDYLDEKKDSISIYNSLWGKAFGEHYQSLMAEELGVEAWGIENSTQIINDWVGTRTQGNIKAFATTEKIASDDMFASGAILFMPEKPPFEIKQADVKQFFNLDGTISKVTLLKGEAVADYFENADMQVVKLAYPSGDTLTLFLPNNDIDFEDFIDEININILKPKFERKEVQILIPNFDFEYGINGIQNIYELFGVKRIFAKENYDFAKMVSFDEQIKIKNVFLKSRISLGRENATSDAEDLSTKVFFEADHPFVFMLNDGDFIGAYIMGDK